MKFFIRLEVFFDKTLKEGWKNITGCNLVLKNSSNFLSQRVIKENRNLPLSPSIIFKNLFPIELCEEITNTTNSNVPSSTSNHKNAGPKKITVEEIYSFIGTWIWMCASPGSSQREFIRKGKHSKIAINKWYHIMQYFKFNAQKMIQILNGTFKVYALQI